MVKLRFPSKDEGVAVLVNLDECIGCRACQIACQEWNGRKALRTSFSPTFTNPRDLHAEAWKVVFFNEFPVTKTLKVAEVETSISSVDVIPVPYNCLHCTEAPCGRACPVGAIKVSDEGAVVIEPGECIGCGFCQDACPYNVPRRGPDGMFYKCSFCVDRIQAGLEPACVEVCPTNVFKFTSMAEAVNIAKNMEAQGKKVYGLNVDSYTGGRLRWIFTASQEKAGRVFPAMFPESAKTPNSFRETVESLAIPAAGIISAIILGLLSFTWLRFKRKGTAESGGAGR